MLQELLDRIADRFQFSRPQRIGILVLVLIALMLSIYFAMLAYPHSDSSELVLPKIGSLPRVPATAEETDSPTLMGKVVVDVAGRVKHPGVYTLPSGSRAIDALHAAGDVLAYTDTSDINLAHVLVDGEQIIVGTSHFSHSSQKININSATSNELDALPGVGPALATRIIAFRKTNGRFQVIADLKKVKGFGGSKFEEIKNLIRV